MKLYLELDVYAQIIKVLKGTGETAVVPEPDIEINKHRNHSEGLPYIFF